MDGYDMRRDGISQSLIYNFMKCPLAGLFGLEWEERSVVDRVRLGNICHHVLEKMYANEGHSDADIDRYLEELEQKPPKWLEGKEKDIQIDLAKTDALMKEYVRAYPDEFGTRVFQESETVFDYEWNGYRLRGKIDAKYKDKRGANWLMEHKTRGQINEDKLVRMLAIDFQNLFYLKAFEETRGQRLRGVMYNIIRNPGTKPHKAETLANYMKRLREDIAKRPAYYFYRFPIKYIDGDRERFEQELIIKLAYVERIINGKQGSFHNTVGCNQCDYLELCVNGSKDKYRPRALFSELEDA